MMRLTLMLLFALAAAPAFAAPLPDPSDIQNALTTPNASIGAYALLTEDLNNFYAIRKFKPAWNFVGPENAAVFANFLNSIEQVIDYHGLERKDYALDEIRKLAAATDDDSRLKLELLTTDTLLRLAHDLHGDNNDLNDLYLGWDFQRTDVDIPGLLAAAVAANALNEFADSMSPKNPAYTQLARALMGYRMMAANGGWKPVDTGKIVRAGDP